MTNNNRQPQWQPIVGDETQSLMERLARQQLDDAVRQRIQQSAASILSRCIPPNAPGGTTGLVLGQVQSGKTMSFTTVATLARDNGYRMVIVITGTSIPLLNQSVDRLRRDLGIENENRVWKHIQIEQAVAPGIQVIRDPLAEWNDPHALPHERPTLLITVLKQHQNLHCLTQTLRRISLQDVPTLIIDDEADQASLNNQVLTAQQSTTYRRILELRNTIPQHTFLQYTATPQAPLLINIIDALSPRFAHVLEAGRGYCGGHEFFNRTIPSTIREIPLAEISTRQRPLHEPPPTFFDALQLFFVGVASACCRGETGQGNRSMMIHPSMFTTEHAQYQHWVEQTKEEWIGLLNLRDDDPDKIQLLRELRIAADNLRTTEPSLPSDQDLESRYIRAITLSRVKVLNATRGRIPEVRWADDYALILIGGTALDRGFTVRGLTITYMPRSLGNGVADTLQQRARFFGYRESHFGFCRVFLPADVITAFRSYVEHENDLRARLQAFEQTGRPLTEWPREFILDPALRPTRDGLIDIAIRRGIFGNEWTWTKSPHVTSESSANNVQVIEEFLRGVPTQDDEGHAQRTEHQKHLIASGLELNTVLRNLLLRLQYGSIEDSQQLIAIFSVLQRIAENNPRTPVTLYIMSKGNDRKRSVDADDRMSGGAGGTTLFQGANPSERGPRRGTIYAGDSALHTDQGITVQIHFLEIVKTNRERLPHVPAIAIWIAGNLARPIVRQPQGGQ